MEVSKGGWKLTVAGQQTRRPRAFAGPSPGRAGHALECETSHPWSQAARLGDRAEEYQEMCSDCLVALMSCPCSGMGDFVAVSPFLCSSRVAQRAKGFLPVPP